MRSKFHLYQRPFKTPLKTSHGVWKIREGIIVELINEKGEIGQGEIAPLPWFGSETLDEAKRLCQQLTLEAITPEKIAAIPNNFPACQFGFGSALEDLKMPLNRDSIFSSGQYCILLPTGESALNFLNAVFNPEQTFKWKIGVQPIEQEVKIFRQLIAKLPPTVKLRLDANGGLTVQEAEQWLEECDRTKQVEFLEQPLPPEQLDALLTLNERYTTPLALDESVATLGQLEACYQRGWRGIFVIKAAILGFPHRLRQFCRNHPIDAVFSSVFETEVARKVSLGLAAELSNPNRALGFGVQHWFEREY